MNKIKRFAVAGFPVAQSKSPQIFNHLFSLMEIQASYTRISTGSGSEALEIFHTLDLTGMNITTPIKSEIKNIADRTDEASGQIGGVNTLLNENGTISGFNTDHLGVSESLSEEDIVVKGKKCLVLGAGNAGRAAVYALQKMGGDVTIINRTYKKAHILAGDMQCRSAVFEKLHSELSGCDIFISTLSSGTEVIKESWFKKDLVVFDANYHHSLVSNAASSAGCRVIRGEKWLLNQAIPAFKIFTGINIDNQIPDNISGVVDPERPPVSRINLAGDSRCITPVKNNLSERLGDIELSDSSTPEEFRVAHSGKNLKESPFNILIYTGSTKGETEFYPFSDLIVWGRDGVDDCVERILKEISRVR